MRRRFRPGIERFETRDTPTDLLGTDLTTVAVTFVVQPPPPPPPPPDIWTQIKVNIAYWCEQMVNTIAYP